MIVSPVMYNRRVGLASLCSITSQVKGYPFEAQLPAGLKVGGVVLSDQVKCLDWRARNVTFICKLPDSVVDEVRQKLNVLLA